MAWTNKAVQAAAAALEGGSIFGNLDEIGARKMSDIITGQVYELGRFEVFKKTANYKDPYVTLELNGIIYSGYARAIGNQFISMAQKAALDPVNECYVTEQKAYTEVEVGMPVIFKEEESQAGKYKVMEFYDAAAAAAEEAAKFAAAGNAPADPTTDKAKGKNKGKKVEQNN